MGCKRYEILLVDAQGQAKQTREWTETQLLSSVAWLKRMNARGHDVLIRPATRSGLTVLDRLTHGDVAKLERIGVLCSSKIQVAADRFQVWLHLRTAEESQKLLDGLAASMGLQPPDRTNFGKLAGFVNHRSAEQGCRGHFVLAFEPINPGPERIAKWERMVEEAGQPLNYTEHDASNIKRKGRSR